MKNPQSLKHTIISAAGLVLLALFISGCSNSVEDLPRYKAIDLKNISATHEVLDWDFFSLIEREGIYGVTEAGKSVTGKADGYKAAFTSWGSIESLREKLLKVANGDKPIALVGKYNDFAQSRVDFRSYRYTYYNQNCWSNPRREFNVDVSTDYAWDGYRIDEPTLETKQSWGEFDCVMTGIITAIKAVGSEHACDAGGFVSFNFNVYEIFNKKTGKRVWPPVE